MVHSSQQTLLNAELCMATCARRVRLPTTGILHKTVTISSGYNNVAYSSERKRVVVMRQSFLSNDAH
jgi:hypothetical protein